MFFWDGWREKKCQVSVERNTSFKARITLHDSVSPVWNGGGVLGEVWWGWIHFGSSCSTAFWTLWTAVMRRTWWYKLVQRHPLGCVPLDSLSQSEEYVFKARREGGGMREACVGHVHEKLCSCVRTRSKCSTSLPWAHQPLGQGRFIAFMCPDTVR